MKKRVLLVEDHPGTIDVVTLELKYLGYEVIVAIDGIKAVEVAASELPDLIIMDVSMPRMNGLEATARIRQNAKTQFIPILAATAKAMPQDKEKCLAAGCDAYIAKPFTHTELGAAIEKLLEK